MKLPQWIKEIKWFIQRGKRGWADCDWWNLDNYISKIMIASMDELMWKGCHVGCGEPWEFDEEARTIRHLYMKMQRFFELHKLMMDNPQYWHVKELRRLYKASGLLLIRNFGRLWD